MTDNEVGTSADTPWMTGARRDELRGRKRVAILDAAARVFTEHGYNNVTVDDIAASLGVTKPTLYHYFDSKEDMVVACAQVGLDMLERSWLPIQKRKLTGLRRLQKFLRVYGTYIQSNFGKVVVRLGDKDLSPKNQTRIRKIKQRVDDMFRELVAEGVSDGTIATQDVRLTSVALAGLMNSFGTWFQTGGRMPGPTIIKHHIGLVTYGLAPRPPAPAGANRGKSKRARAR